MHQFKGELNKKTRVKIHSQQVVSNYVKMLVDSKPLTIVLSAHIRYKYENVSGSQ